MLAEEDVSKNGVKKIKLITKPQNESYEFLKLCKINGENSF